MLFASQSRRYAQHRWSLINTIEASSKQCPLYIVYTRGVIDLKSVQTFFDWHLEGAH